jgi:YD repeat-containing protein
MGGLKPVKVGGVSLRGAGAALKEIGPLKGIGIDAHGRLVLIGQDKSDIGLPPLRLEDVVTVFRGVYERGEAPYVSIDPDPKNPRGPTMNVRHSPGTAQTYVGWILFETDRVMKVYGLGTDNVTRQKVHSAVEGYREMMDKKFGSNKKSRRRKKKKDDSRWQRYWLVPGQVRRLESRDRRLSLIDLAIKVETEPMIMRNGKLESAPSAKPRAGSREFSTWFTRHYDGIAREVRSRPPSAMGGEGDVAVFAELRRIALIAAIAERLRDQGVPMPGWMREYPVPAFPVPTKTPAITAVLERQRGRITQRVSTYGGTVLSAPAKAVRTVAGASQAEALAPALWQAVDRAPALSPVAFAKDGQSYKAVALPGEDTQEFGPCLLDETDLSVPVPGSAPLRMTRFYHSFFTPRGELGSSWSLDLPRLYRQERRIPGSGKTVHIQYAFQLTSPLGTVAEFFNEQKEVPEIKRTLAVPRSSRHMLGVMATADKKNILYFRDGGRWEFNEAGYLIAEINPDSRVLYHRDAAQRLVRIEGGWGQARAEIVLTYDAQNRLHTARGSNGESVTYQYDSAGRLLHAAGPAGPPLSYRYKELRVAAVLEGRKVVRRFEYSPTGRLRKEWQEDGRAVAYRVKTGPRGTTIAAESKGKAIDAAEYDADYRPLRRVLEDGTRLQWKYSKGGTAEISVRLPDGERCGVVRSADGRQETWQLPGGARLKAEYDEAGRMTRMDHDGRPVLRQTYHPTGRLATLEMETTVFRPRYNRDGAIIGVSVAKPAKPGEPNYSWLEYRFDEQGRLTSIDDYSGSRITVAYNRSGKPKAWSGARGKTEVRRDKQGRVQTVETSWGYREERSYDARGQLKTVAINQGQKREVLEYQQGRLTAVRQFDGGEVAFAYRDSKTRGKRLSEMRVPNGLVVKYGYQKDRLSTIQCGKKFRLDYVYDDQGRLTGIAQAPVSQR